MIASSPAYAAVAQPFSTENVYSGVFDKTNAALLAAAQRDPQFADNLLQESGRYPDEIANIRQDAKSLAQQMNSEVREMIYNFELLHYDWFTDFHRLGDENQDFYMEEQYTNADRHAMLKRNRKPYEFNIVTPFIDNLRGEQLGQRTDWEAQGMTPISEQYAEGATHYLKWVRQSYENQYEQVESDVFRDGIVRGLGVIGVRPDWTNPFGSVRIERMLGREFWWDVHSATNANWDGCKYLLRRSYIDRVRLATMYPEWRSEILALAGGITGQQGWETGDALNRPKVGPLTNQLNSFSTSFDPQLRAVYGGLIFVREFYHRRYIDKIKVVDGFTGDGYYFDSDRDAADGKAMLEQWWMQSGALNMVGAAAPRVSNPMPCNVSVIDQYVFAGDQLLRVITQAMDRFPYEPFMPDYYDGTVISVLGRGKHRQRFINKLISYMEEIAGGTKPQVGVNKARLSGQETDPQIVEKMQREGVWIFDSKEKDFNVASQFHSFNPQQNAQMVSSLYSVVRETVQQLYGSNAAMGSSDYAGQSGTSQMALRSYASTTTMSIFDKLSVTSVRVAEDALFYGQYMDPVVSMAVRQDSGEVLYRSLDSFGIQRLGDLRFRVRPVEVLATPSERERRQKYVLELAGQLGPQRAAALEPLILRNSMLPYSDKKEISDRLAAIDQRESDLAERQQKLQEDELEFKRKMQLGALVNKSREIDILESNPAKITASYKIPAGPLMTQAVVEHAGIADAHPAVIESDVANQALLDQQIDDLRMEHWYNNMPEWARDKVNPPKAPVASPKDASARKRKGAEQTT